MMKFKLAELDLIEPARSAALFERPRRFGRSSS
jgi:hypothetical protein